VVLPRVLVDGAAVVFTGLQGFSAIISMIDWGRIADTLNPPQYCVVFGYSKNAQEWRYSLNNFAKCIGAATVEYARWRASMRELFGWKFEG
jgi:hypothetical protein